MSKAGERLIKGAEQACAIAADEGVMMFVRQIRDGFRVSLEAPDRKAYSLPGDEVMGRVADLLDKAVGARMTYEDGFVRIRPVNEKEPK